MLPRLRLHALTLGALLSILSSAAASAESPEARGLEIARKVDRAESGFGGEESEVVMELVNPQGDVVTRKLTLKTLEREDDGDRSLIEFHWPRDVQKTKLLTWAHRRGNDDQWLFLPAMKKTTRIAARSKSGSFMGSEFAYEDLASREVEKFTYRALEDASVDGRPVWVIEAYPVDKDSGYKRQVLRIDKEYLAPVRVDYFDRKDELLKTAALTGYRVFGKWFRPARIEMQNVQTRKRSVLKFEKRKLGQKYDEIAFERNSLEE